MNQVADQYEQGGLPMPKHSGSLAALQQYFGQADVRKRVAFRLNDDPKRADRALANLYEVIETSKNPSMLLKCDPRSIITTCVQAEQLGIAIDARQLAYPVPRYNKDKGVTECNMQIGWRGYVARLKQKLRGCEVVVELVYEGDEFKVIGEGVRQSYIHEPADPFADGNSGENGCKGGYCYVEWIGDDGERKSICGRMSIADIQKARSVATTDTIWKQWWGEQAKKTIIKRTCKVQFSAITADLDAHDNEDYDLSKQANTSGRASAADIKDKMRKEDEPENKDTVSDNQNVTDIDPDTGEVVGADAEDVSRSADDRVDGKESVGSDPVIHTDTEEEGGELENNPDSVPETASEATHAPTTETIDHPSQDEIVLPEGTTVWDGRSIIIQGKKIEKEFNGITAAVKYLEGVIGKRTKRSIRKQILQENLVLVNTLIANKMIGKVDYLYKLANEGEEDGC